MEDIVLLELVGSLDRRARPSLEGAPIGGAERDRTVDLRLAKPALSQLSYSPEGIGDSLANFVGQGRLELPTSRLSGVRSNHLSYWPCRPVIRLGPWKLDCMLSVWT